MTNPNDNSPERRSVEVSVEVPGTPEEVWEAIATGPGIESWFVPTEIDGRVGGKVRMDMGGAGMEDSGVVTAWDPPHRYVGEDEWAPTGAEPSKLAIEYLVEARSGGTCVVRIVSSVYATGSEWDEPLESMREGWEVYLHNLLLYLTHFSGRYSSTIQAAGTGTGTQQEVWAAFTGALGIGETEAPGERVSVTADDAPTLAGVVDREIHTRIHDGVILVLDEPAPGVALILVNVWEGAAHTNIQAHLFGDGAAEAADRDQSRWQEWMQRHFRRAGAETAQAS